jgi:hypothetical protein
MLQQCIKKSLYLVAGRFFFHSRSPHPTRRLPTRQIQRHSCPELRHDGNNRGSTCGQILKRVCRLVTTHSHRLVATTVGM